MSRENKQALYLLGERLIKNRKPVAIITTLVTIWFGWHASQLQLITSFGELLPKGHPFIDVHDEYAKDFGGANNITVMVNVEEGNLFNVENLSQIYLITEEMDRIYGVNHNQIDSIGHRTTRHLAVAAAGTLRSEPIMIGMPKTEHDATEIRRIVHESENVYGILVSLDDKAALVRANFIEGRLDDRVGLIIFGSQAFVLSPLTMDREAVRHLLSDLVPRIAGDGTAMGDALGLGVKKLRERPQGSRVLVLIADGENTAGLIPPLEAARLAAREGIRIYAIGVGSDQKEVPIIENGRLVTRDDLGFDEEVMRRIANATGGAYFRATDTSALETIYQRIDELEKSEAESRTVMIPHPLFRWPLAMALLALLALGLFPGARSRRLVRRGRHD